MVGKSRAEGVPTNPERERVNQSVQRKCLPPRHWRRGLAVWWWAAGRFNAVRPFWGYGGRQAREGAGGSKTMVKPARKQQAN